MSDDTTVKRTAQIKELYDDKSLIAEFERTHRQKVPPYQMFNELPIHFDPQWKHVGLSFSGGADSSLLFYILCKIIEDTKSQCQITPITLVRFFEDKPWLEYMSIDVYNFLKERFPNIIKPQVWGFVPPFLESVKIKNLGDPKLNSRFEPELAHCDVAVVDSFLTYQRRKLGIHYIYSGVTTNPPLNNIEAPAFREAHIVKDKLIHALGVNYICPLALINKNWIMAQYQNLNLTESLLPLTRSCENDMYYYGLTSWSPGMAYPPPCGECFFCEERQWGQKHSAEYLL